MSSYSQIQPFLPARCLRCQGGSCPIKHPPQIPKGLMWPVLFMCANGSDQSRKKVGRKVRTRMHSSIIESPQQSGKSCAVSWFASMNRAVLTGFGRSADEALNPVLYGHGWTKNPAAQGTRNHVGYEAKRFRMGRCARIAWNSDRTNKCNALRFGKNQGLTKGPKHQIQLYSKTSIRRSERQDKTHTNVGLSSRSERIAFHPTHRSNTTQRVIRCGSCETRPADCEPRAEILLRLPIHSDAARH